MHGQSTTLGLNNLLTLTQTPFKEDALIRSDHRDMVGAVSEKGCCASAVPRRGDKHNSRRKSWRCSNALFESESDGSHQWSGVAVSGTCNHISCRQTPKFSNFFQVHGCVEPQHEHNNAAQLRPTPTIRKVGCSRPCVVHTNWTEKNVATKKKNMGSETSGWSQKP